MSNDSRISLFEACLEAGRAANYLHSAAGILREAGDERAAKRAADLAREAEALAADTAQRLSPQQQG